MRLGTRTATPANGSYPTVSVQMVGLFSAATATATRLLPEVRFHNGGAGERRLQLTELTAQLVIPPAMQLERPRNFGPFLSEVGACSDGLLPGHSYHHLSDPARLGPKRQRCSRLAEEITARSRAREASGTVCDNNHSGNDDAQGQACIS